MNPRETILYTAVGYVASDKSAIDFADTFVEELVLAKAMVEKDRLPIHITLKTTLVKEHMTEEGLEKFDIAIKNLSRVGIDSWIEYWPSGPTRSRYGVFFDQGAIASGFKATATGDLDNFPLSRNLENYLALFEETLSRNALIGVGERDEEVKLTSNTENNYLREIFEGFMNQAVLISKSGNNKEIHSLRKGKNQKDPYKSQGDFMTGAYILNLSHPELTH